MNIKRLIKKAEIYGGTNNNGQYYEIYKNPTQREINEINKQAQFGSVRGIIAGNGDVFAWAGDIVHSGMIREFNLPEGIHFDMFKFVLDLVLKPGMDPDYLHTVINSASSLFNFVDSSMKININTNIYKAENYDIYKKLKTLNDIINLDVGEINETTN